jgi:hypothetical protein
MGVLLAVVAITVGVVVAVRGGGHTPQAAGGSGGPDYTAPGDGSGYDTAVWDQPDPLPVGSCSWQKDALPALTAVDAGLKITTPNQSGCQFLLGDATTYVQVRMSGAYDRISQGVTVLEPATFAGVPGRLYAFRYSTPTTICSAQLATHSLVVPTVDVDAEHTGGDQQQHCQIARQVANVLATRYVPLAGGTPVPGAAQQNNVPPAAGATVTTSKLGPDALRLEQAPTRCTASVEYNDGHVFQVSMGPKSGDGSAITCQADRVALANILGNQLVQGRYGHA